MGKRIREIVKRLATIEVPTTISNRHQLSKYLRSNIEHVLNESIRAGLCFCADNTRIFERFAILSNGKKQIWTQCDVCGRKLKNIKEEKGKNYDPIDIDKNNDYRFTYELSNGDFFCKVFAKLFAKHYKE